MPALAVGTCSSPLGTIEVRSTARGILSLRFLEEEPGDAAVSDELQPCFEQLSRYFGQRPEAFHSLVLAIQGTEFQGTSEKYSLRITQP